MAMVVIIIALVVVVGSVSVHALRRPSDGAKWNAHQADRPTFLDYVLLPLPAVLVLVVLIASGSFLIGTSHYHGWEGNGGTLAWLFVFGLPLVSFALGAYLVYLHRFLQSASVVATGAVVCFLMAFGLIFVSPWCYSHCTTEEGAAISAYNHALLLLCGGGLAGLVGVLLLIFRDSRSGTLSNA